MKENLSIGANAWTSVFYLTTGFHGMHVTGGLLAFLLVLGRTYMAKRFTHDQATSAIVGPTTGTSSTWCGSACSS